MMKKVLIIFLLTLLVCTVTWTITGQGAEKGAQKGAAVQGTEQKMDAGAFLKQFAEAFKAQDQTKMEELVKQGGADIVFNWVVKLAGYGIKHVAEGKEGAAYFNAAEALAAIYAKEFKKENLPVLVKTYRQYSQDMCREKLKGGDLIENGNSIYEKAQWNEALDIYTEALKIYKKLGDLVGEANCLTNIGLVYHNLGQYQEALDHHKQSSKIVRQIGDVAGETNSLIAIGNAYDSLGQHDQAIAEYTKAMKIQQDSAQAYNNRGNAYYAKGEYDEALSDYTKAININPDYADAYRDRGLAYHAKGQHDLAALDYSKAIDLDPKYADAYNDRGNAYWAKGEFDKALSDYTKAISMKPHFTEAYRNRGALYERNGEYDLAISDYTKAIESDPKYALAYSDRGDAHYAKEQYDLAIADYTKAIELNPRFAEAYNNRANVYYAKGQFEQATSDASKAIEINPEYSDAFYNKALACEQMGRISDAIEAYRRFIQLAGVEEKSQVDAALEKLAKLEDTSQILEENVFLENFERARRVNDYARLISLIKRAEIITYGVVIHLSKKAMANIAEGKAEATDFKNVELIAEIYQREFKTVGLLELVRRYKNYNQEKCKVKLKADNIVDDGVRLSKENQWKEALEKWTMAQGIYAEIGDLDGEGSSLRLIGDAYGHKANYLKALSYYESALENSQKTMNRDLEATTLANMGVIYESLGRYGEALSCNEKAIEWIRKKGIVAPEVTILTNIGNIYEGLGQYEKALSYYKNARGKMDISSFEQLLVVMERLGTTYLNLGRYAEALSYYAQMSKFCEGRELVNDQGEIIPIKPIKSEEDRILAILDFMTTIMFGHRMCQEIEAVSLANMGLFYNRMGQYSDALNSYKRGLSKYEVVGNAEGQAGAFISIGSVYSSLGKYVESLESYHQALKIIQSLGNPAGKMEIAVYSGLGTVYLKLGQYQQALEYYEKAMPLVGQIGVPDPDLLLDLGITQYQMEQYADAVDNLREAVKASEQQGKPETVWRAHTTIGEALWKLGEAEQARSHYVNAVEIIEELYAYTRGLKEEWRSTMIREKRHVYEDFIQLLMDLHRKSADKGYDREAFVISEKSKSRTFQEMMAKAGAKIAFSEEAKDETFKKMIEREQQLIRELMSLKGLLTKELSKSEKERNEEAVISIKEQISKVEKTLTDLEKEIDSKYPRYADLKRPKSLTVEELQEVLKPGETVLAYAVGKDKTVAFVIAKGRFKMVELSVSPKDLAQLVRQFRKGLDNVLELKDLEQFKPEIAFTLYQQLVAPLSSELKGVSKLYISADSILYTLPFEALVDQEVNREAFREAHTRGKQGDGAYLGEYETLHYLVDNPYTITYLPSASVLRSLRKYEKPGYGKWSKPLIAFADPIFSEEDRDKDKDKDNDKVEVKDKGLKPKGITSETQLTIQLLTRSTGNEKLERLKESAQEAEAISKELKSKKEDIYLRKEATEENVYNIELKNARYLLFSTHGLLGGDFSGVAEPALALTLIDNPPGRDGFLTMSEVLGLDLNTELIILSACNTSGKGDKSGSGEGFVGLTRSFMYAGGKSLLVTHWSVESEAARDLMVNTMRFMRVKTKPDALREAKLNMKKSIRQSGKEKLSLSHPFFWAPFVLVGEGS
jgi:tetratricopeptide (TPR) repeat protein